MIRVLKPADGPPILSERGKRLTEACCRAVESGSLPVFERSVYGHASVKDALKRAQHGKCCYCEAPIAPAGHGDVDHFRPKKAVRQGESDPEIQPGYYWLAYTWSNLFLSCQVCNQSHKRTFFPLADASRRVRSHGQDLADETPLLLDPAADDPERSIGFRREVPFARDVRGETTIRCLGLGRPHLQESRADRLAAVEHSLDIVAIAERIGEHVVVEQALAGLQRMSSDAGIHAAAVREHLRVRLGADVVFPVESADLRRRLDATRRPVADLTPEKPAE